MTSHKIKVVLKRFEKNLAVLVTENKKQILWPREELPSGVKKGDYLYLSSKNDSLSNNLDRFESEEDRKKMAKVILEEILNG